MVDGKTPFHQKNYKHIGTKLVKNLNDKQLTSYHEKKNIKQQKLIQSEMYATVDRTKPRKSTVESPSQRTRFAGILDHRQSEPKAWPSRNQNASSNYFSRQTADQAKTQSGLDTDERYKLKIRSSIRTKTNRNQNKLKSQSYGQRDQIKVTESLDKDLIKRIEQDLKLYDLRQNN